MVVDQLLVGKQAAEDDGVRHVLHTAGAVFATNVFGDRDQPRENVQIWRLADTPGTHPHPDVADVVWKARVVCRKQGIAPAQVAPNHVLVPAANIHACPFGPPHAVQAPGKVGPAGDGPKVTVIDAGLLELGPLVGRITPRYASWVAEAGGALSWEPGAMTIAAGLDPRDQDRDERLDALAGHANFVAGVIAQACPRAQITVVGHQALYVGRDSDLKPIATEAAVARSVWENRGAAVLHVGFAFPTLPNVDLNRVPGARGGPPSWVFEVVLDAIPSTGVLVAPAGNQGCLTPQYPAAFGMSHENVVGVGSLRWNGNRSRFSNRGRWVKCWAEGEGVVSTFVGWNGPTEEAEPDGSHPVKHFASEWAAWSGTSFAAPKVAAAVSCRTPAGSDDGLGGWKQLRSEHGGGPGAMNMRMPGLRPTRHSP
jgi:hypothetical protein